MASSRRRVSEETESLSSLSSDDDLPLRRPSKPSQQSRVVASPSRPRVVRPPAPVRRRTLPRNRSSDGIGHASRQSDNPGRILRRRMNIRFSSQESEGGSSVDYGSDYDPDTIEAELDEPIMRPRRPARPAPAPTLDPPPPRPRPRPEPFPLDLRPLEVPMQRSRSSHASSSTSETSEPVERRFTAQEKGKSRAAPLSPIDMTGESLEDVHDAVDTISEESKDVEDESIQVIGEKRRRLEEEAGQPAQTPVAEGSEMDAESLLAAYTCPVCFSAPTEAVMTVCGHILCASCLHSSLVAAIRRNPNPWPQRQPRSRTRHPRRTSSNPSRAMAQPNEWAEDSLREAWRAYLEPKLQKQYDAGQLGRGMSTQDWQVTKEGFLEDVSVRKVLLGLWEVDEQYVVEGECPVCRKALPGGYGPPDTGIGGIVPLLPAKLSRSVRAR